MTIDLFIVLLQKPRLNVTENAHLTTRMRTGGGVYFFHGLLILRYTGSVWNYQLYVFFIYLFFFIYLLFCYNETLQLFDLIF